MSLSESGKHFVRLRYQPAAAPCVRRPAVSENRYKNRQR